jgi:hypothetical protein
VAGQTAGHRTLDRHPAAVCARSPRRWPLGHHAPARPDTVAEDHAGAIAVTAVNDRCALISKALGTLRESDAISPVAPDMSEVAEAKS